MQESYERVRKCAKVKGRVELKIDKTQSARPEGGGGGKNHPTPAQALAQARMQPKIVGGGGGVRRMSGGAVF